MSIQTLFGLWGPLRAVSSGLFTNNRLLCPSLVLLIVFFLGKSPRFRFSLWIPDWNSPDPNSIPRLIRSCSLSFLIPNSIDLLIRMGEKRISNSRYEYVHEKGNWPSGVIDIHHVRVLRGTGLMRVLLLCVSFAVLVFLLKDDLDIFMICYLLIGVMFIRLLIHKQVVKESVLILPAFGVQLETHYKSGRVTRRFVPINKILRPVLNEYVTPVTCYWSLALLLREENELMLVFKELHPTLEMMTPIWKGLCTGVDPE